MQHAFTGGGDGGSIAYGMPGASLLALVVLPLAYALTPDAPAALGDALGPLIIGLMLASIAIAAIAGGIAITNTRTGTALGITLGVEFAATTYDIYTDTHPATWAGVAALVASKAEHLHAGRRWR